MKERLFWGNRRVMLLHRKNAKFYILNLAIVFTIFFVVSSFVTIYNYPNEINLMQGQSKKLENSLLCKLVLDNIQDENINLSKLNNTLSSFTLIKGKTEGSANATLKMLNLLPIKSDT